jgi:hypothetical protein
MSKHINDLKQYLYEDDIVSFGKYQGLMWRVVLISDPNYIVWCVGNTCHKFEPTLVVRAIQQDYAQRNARKASQTTYNKKFCQLDAGKPNNVGWDDWDDDIPF